MKKIEIHTPSQNSVIYCEKGVFRRLAPDYLSGHENFVLTDSNVYALYAPAIKSVFGNTPLYILPAGEESKNYQNLFSILQAMIEAKLHRNSYLFALGGGVVGDIGGLAASLYMRGIHCVQIPTTLLAQVDSSVGGKTAVDMGKVKNVVGAFYQPEAVLVDSTFLQTLPAREIRCGLGEIVKYGGLNGKILDRLLANRDQLFSLDFLAEITPACIEHKADVVRKDEKEANLRKSLNMGHTTAHALELCYGDLSHGEFVLVGMYYEIEIALAEGMIAENYARQLRSLILKVMGTVPQYADVSEAMSYAKLDKKNTASDVISMIVPTAYDEYTELKLPFERYRKYMQQFAEKSK
jgi:3-dehydroquinate synthase